MGETLDAGKGGLEAVPLRLILLPAVGDGDGVFEGTFV